MRKFLIIFSLCFFVNTTYCGNITFINSDIIEYKNNTIKCNGNILIVYNKKVISAEYVEYDQKSDIIKAKNNVIIKDEFGNTYFASFAEIKNNFESGFISDLKIITSDKIRLATDNCKIINKKYELKNAIFTPCYECTNSGTLTWQLKSKYVLFDPSNQTSYEDAVLEAFDVPVVYLPYFNVISPNVRRKSGFLLPNFTTSSQQGFGMVIPYLWSISESQELIFKPVFTTKIGHVAWIYYGLRIPHGQFELDASITGTKSVDKVHNNNKLDKKMINKIKASHYRGHIFSKFNYDIDRHWRTGFNINLISDQQYFKRFFFMNDLDRTLISTTNIEGFHNRNYTQVKASIFQTDYLDSVPKLLPLIEHTHIMNLFTGTFQVDATCINLVFKRGRISQKYTINPSWTKNFILSKGQLLDFNIITSFQGLQVSERQHSDYDSYSQILPQCNLTWQWPLIINSYISEAVISPILGVSLSPNKNHFDLMENSFDEINESNVFSNNKSISPYNIDSGCRYFYGTKINGYSMNKKLYNFMIGRSVDINKSHKMLESSGKKRKHSNIISKLDMFFTENLAFSTTCSYSPKNKSFDKLELNLNYNEDRLSFDIMAFKGVQCFYDPFKINENDLIESISQKKYKGVNLSCNYKTSSTTTLKYNIVFGNNYSPIDSIIDKHNSKLKLLRHGLNLIYENECTKFSFGCERINYNYGDLKPETCLKFTIHLKKLV